MQAFMNQTESAQYCGYSVDTFRRHMKTYPLPKYGPKANRYKCLDLDKWMEDPEQFRVATHRPSHTEESSLRQSRRRQSSGIT